MLHGEERSAVQVSTPSIAPAKLAVCVFFAVLPSNFKRPYLFNRLADLGEFYVKSKGFPCSTQKSSDFGRMDEKRGGLSSSCGAFSGLKIPGMALLVTWGTGLRPERDSYAMLSSFGRCYMGKNESPFKFNLVYRPGKVGCLCLFSLFCPPTSKGHIFSTAWPIWVNFMSNQRVFRALRRNRAILEEWTKKEGAFLPHVGPFQG